MYTFDIANYSSEEGPEKPMGIVKGMHEYWDYLGSGKQWDKSKNGLLNFLYDCVQTLITLQIKDHMISSSLTEVRAILVEMKEQLIKRSKEFELNSSALIF
mgnify:CR=1 FL=1